MFKRTPLFRMMFLIVFIIIILVIFSTRLSHNMVYNANDPFFKEYFILQNKNQANTLLLHSLTFNDSSISAHSIKLDTIMTFAKPPSDINFIYKKLEHVPYTPQQCIKCHSAMRN